MSPYDLDKYQNFAEEQLGNWRQIDALIQKLNSSETLDPKAVIAEIAKLKQTTEHSMHRAEKNLQDLQHISRPVTRVGQPENSEKRRPVKPTSPDNHTNPQLRLEIEKIRADSLRETEKMGLGSHRSNPEDSACGGKTPSQSSINIIRRTTEKWLDPRPEKLEEQKAALAKAIISDKEGRNKWNEFKLNSLRNSIVSVSSNENNNPLHSPTGRTHPDLKTLNLHHKRSPLEHHDPASKIVQDSIDCNVMIDENEKGGEENAVIELNSYRADNYSEDAKPQNKQLEFSEHEGSETPVTYPGVPTGSPLNEYLDPTSHNWMEMAKITSLAPVPDLVLSDKLSNKLSVIAIENAGSEGLKSAGATDNEDSDSSQEMRLKDPGQKLFLDSARHAREAQTDIITAEVLNQLFEELMMDGLVLRELFKLQVEMPKGIKTNIRAIKKYLARLCEYINSRPRLRRQLLQGNRRAAQHSDGPDSAGKAPAVPLRGGRRERRLLLRQDLVRAGPRH